eukprot:15451023-Alexandrium_andersonii.AAC.3
MPRCPVCLRFFHEVCRVVHHVSLDPRHCGDLVLQHIDPWTHEQVYREPTRADRKVARATVGAIIPPSGRPALQALGPLPEWA